jgi:hypothetical protein
MTQNSRLFNLGNQLYNLGEKIEKRWQDEAMGKQREESGPTSAFLRELVTIVNEMRCAILEGPDPKQTWEMTIIANAEDFAEIRKVIHDRKLVWELKKGEKINE